MASTTTTTLRIASPNGPVTRTVLAIPIRDALPSEIPLISIAPLLSPSSTLAARRAVAAEIRAAALHTGFFYILHHGIPAAVLSASRAAAVSFFRQDLSIKARSTTFTRGFRNGYRGADTEAINPAEGLDVKEAFTLRYDPRWDPAVADQAAIPESVRAAFGHEDDAFAHTTNMPAFGEATKAHFQACLQLARTMTRAFALSLDLPEDAWDDKGRYPGSALGINYYPPLAGAAGETVPRVSIGSHTDFQLFTMLWQDDAGGLQVLNREGQWIRAAPVPGTLVVNVGDFLQRITNDRYVSTVHRAQNGSGRERVSVAFFCGFGFHESCGVLETCVPEGEQPRYGEVNCRAWVSKRLADMQDLAKSSW